MTTPRAWLIAARARLEQAGYDTNEARSAASLLLAEHLGCKPLELPLHQEELDADSLEQPLSRLAAGEPLQYILGHTGFFGLDLITGPGALIPRFDSECVVEAALSHLPAQATTAADLCTGSGALALALASQRPGLTVHATDISRAALAVARANVAHLGLEERVRLYQGDMAQPLLGRNIQVELVICNPPYIPGGELPALPPQVRQEPTLALNGGVDGLDYYRQLAQEAGRLLLPGGWLLVEHGDEQADAVAALLAEGGFFLEQRIFDLSGRPRGLALRLLHGFSISPPSAGEKPSLPWLAGAADDPWEPDSLPQTDPNPLAQNFDWEDSAPDAPDTLYPFDV